MSLKSLIKELNFTAVFFDNINVPLQSIEDLKKLINILEKSSINTLDELDVLLNNKKNKIDKTNPHTKLDINYITLILKKENKTHKEKALLEKFFEQYPNLKDIETLSTEDLFHVLNKSKVNNWKKDELKFILFFYFNIPVKENETKEDLYNMIKDFTLQLNHIQSFNQKNM
ncbi:MULTISPECIES: hypothetical protein [Bacillus cereus group]|uniref:Uncharacterized protein n=1 Tax=Bacillus cereus TaxID=1396 RepID=A0A5B9HYL2_BACCE|nr:MULTISPECIES: hypothetical protein [Bacillus cereus group]EEM80178.1 hypothetical protein bthur0011_58870 [Bacillus thuringiensis serovar huazhongensis BGSC 4BD1]QEF20269.1 hypothetical protein FRY47_28645 [Bacillus cereus]WIG15327.1 hypothetical protein QOM09_29075 [Bacillus thuringiensis]